MISDGVKLAWYADEELPTVEGVVPVTDREEIRVSWKKSGGDVKIECRAPTGWIVRQIRGTK